MKATAIFFWLWAVTRVALGLGLVRAALFGLPARC